LCSGHMGTSQAVGGHMGASQASMQNTRWKKGPQVDD
jgi:hypothetical protein